MSRSIKPGVGHRINSWLWQERPEALPASFSVHLTTTTGHFAGLDETFTFSRVDWESQFNRDGLLADPVFYEPPPDETFSIIRSNLSPFSIPVGRRDDFFAPGDNQFDGPELGQDQDLYSGDPGWERRTGLPPNIVTNYYSHDITTGKLYLGVDDTGIIFEPFGSSKFISSYGPDAPGFPTGSPVNVFPRVPKPLPAVNDFYFDKQGWVFQQVDAPPALPIVVASLFAPGNVGFGTGYLTQAVIWDFKVSPDAGATNFRFTCRLLHPFENGTSNTDFIWDLTMSDTVDPGGGITFHNLQIPVSGVDMITLAGLIGTFTGSCADVGFEFDVEITGG